MLKRYLVFVFALCSLQAFAQSYSADTVVIGEVVIRAIMPQQKYPGFKVVGSDSAILREYALQSIAEMLSHNSSLFIKSYGSGGSATPSLRGTGAGNTRVTWNGIRLDNPMLGQPDLSILPAGFTDDVSISYGGASLALGSGTAGGNIAFETDAGWDKPSNLSVATGAASFGNYSGLISAKTGTGNYRSVTKGFYNSAENDFPFTNRVYGNEPFTEKRINSQMEQYGFMQEVYYRTLSDIFSARVWYQKAERNLPSSVLLMQSANLESQDDESLRLMLGYDHESKVGNFFFTGAFVTDRLDYTNKLASIDSRNLSSTITAKGGVKGIDLPWNLEADLMFNEEISSVKSNNYESRPFRNSADLTAMVSNHGNARVRGTLLAREIIYMDRLLIPDFSAGMQIKPFLLHDYVIRTNIARSSRIPTLNDLYWSPGGNPDLKNEYAWMMEIGYELNRKIDASWNISNEMALFRNSIRDMIQWRPGEFSWWSARNIGRVNTYGFEASMSVKYRNGKASSLLNISYSYTKATDAGATGSEKQLVYVPQNQFNALLKAGYGPFTAQWRTSGNGIRYTVPDNSKYLPAYSVSSAMAGYMIRKTPGLMEVCFEIENIFNKEYETIAYFPLPGRTYSLRLLFQIKSAE